MGVGQSREGVGHEVLSLVQGVGSVIFSYPQGVGQREYKTQPDGIIVKNILKLVASFLKCNFNKMHDFCFFFFSHFNAVLNPGTLVWLPGLCCYIYSRKESKKETRKKYVSIISRNINANLTNVFKISDTFTQQYQMYRAPVQRLVYLKKN